MNRRPLLLVLALLGTLLLPGLAIAKGPSDATITGPGLRSPLTVSGDGAGATPLGRLADWGGFFAQVFSQEPSPLLAARPAGRLGPRYDVTYVVPGPSTDTLRQQLYPYAAGGVYTYMESNQRFWDSQRTAGGWYRGSSGLKSMLVKAGLPDKAPSARKGSSKVMAVGAGAGIVLAAGALFLLRRRR
ncbi:hypothetical protein BH18ACT12_BH18ACT12_21070 [soil metagenome]